MITQPQRQIRAAGNHQFFFAILFFLLLPTGRLWADLSVAYSGTSDQAVIVSFFDRQTVGSSLVGTLQIQNISGTWVYIEQDLTSSANPVAMPYTIYLLGPDAIKTFPNFTFPQGSYLKLVVTTPVGLDFTQASEKRTALQGALAVDLLTRGLLTFSLPPDAFDQPPVGQVVEPLLDNLIATVSPIGELAVAIQDRSATEVSSALLDIAADSTHVVNALTPLVQRYATADQVASSLGFFAELINLPEKAALVTDLSARTFGAPPVTWSRMDVVSRTQVPSISSVSPTVLTTMPVPQTQALTVHGSGFTSASSLVFTIGTATYPSRPERLQFIDANTLQYNIAVGSAVGTWSVRLVGGTGSATFQVQAAPSGLYTITPLSGPHGSITPSAALTRAGGESQTFVATPQNSTFTVDTWYMDGVAVPATGNRFTLADIQAPHTVFVTFRLATVAGQTGYLTVSLQPAGAVSAGAQWQVDGGSYRNSGDTASGLAPGSHSVSFKAVSGYTTPGGHSVSISSGANTTDSGTYTVVTPSTYTLTLNYNPAQGGASPSPLVPETSHTYGSYSFGYAPGSVTLVQASASSGYHFTGWSGDASGTGNPITVTMNGNKNITANFALGDPSLGTLTVTIVPPEAAAAGVTWGFNESDFRTSGTSLQYWPGTYLIYVNGTSGWIGYPSWVTVIAGQTTSVSLPASSTTGTIIGNDPRTYITLAGAAENPGNTDGVGSSARFNSPVGMTVDGAGNVFVTDTGTLVRKISPLGMVTTVAGQAGVSGYADGQGTNAVFNNLQGIAVDSSGNLYVSDMMNSVIRKITPGGAVSTFAGQAGINDSVDGTGSAARFYFPTGIAVDTSGNVYVSDSVNQTIRKITPSRAVTTLAGFPRSYGYADGTGSAARFHSPQGLAVNGSGNVYVAENSNETIRRVTPAGVVSTLAGFPGSAGAADGIGGAARFRFLNGLALDQTGNIYVADQGNEAVRKVTQGGVVTTVAGQSGNPGTADGIGSLARFNHPQGVAVDASGNLYVVDSRNHTIRATTSVATKFDQTITFGTLPSKYINDLPFALTASASSALPVTFSMVSGPASLSNNVVTLTGAGTVTLRASQAGDATFNAATNVDRSFNVAKLPQTIIFGALSRQVLGDAPFALSASASSGLAVSFSLLSGPAILSGNVVTITGAGLVVLRVTQGGDATYASAPDIDQVLIVAPGKNVITDCQRVPNGMFTLRYYGDTGTNYVVMGSTNLLNWLRLATNQIGGLGYLEFTDISSTNLNRRFYRVVGQ